MLVNLDGKQTEISTAPITKQTTSSSLSTRYKKDILKNGSAAVHTAWTKHP